MGGAFYTSSPQTPTFIAFNGAALPTIPISGMHAIAAAIVGAIIGALGVYTKF